MPRQSDLFGVSAVYLGAPDEDGTMPDSMTQFSDVAEGSVQLTLPKSEVERIFSEENRSSPYKIIDLGASQGPKISLNLLGADLDQWATLLGGTYDAGSSRWTFPSDVDQRYKALRVVTKETDENGNQLIIEIPYGLITAGIDGSLTYNNLAQINIDVEGMTPPSEGGSSIAPMSVTAGGTYTVTFDIDETGTDLQYAIIEIAGQKLITDSSGQATINLVDGAWSYTLSAAGKTPKTGTVTVSGSAVTETVDIDA